MPRKAKKSPPKPSIKTKMMEAFENNKVFYFHSSPDAEHPDSQDDDPIRSIESTNLLDITASVAPDDVKSYKMSSSTRKIVAGSLTTQAACTQDVLDTLNMTDGEDSSLYIRSDGVIFMNQPDVGQVVVAVPNTQYDRTCCSDGVVTWHYDLSASHRRVARKSL